MILLRDRIQKEESEMTSQKLEKTSKNKKYFKKIRNLNFLKMHVPLRLAGIDLLILGLTQFGI